ncbi:MAG TPA: prepilin-type N-terminal cleavage/methylation domain-containing protein [Syntrophorhabdaceae bacterium]|jgi:general secretion pathway protein H
MKNRPISVAGSGGFTLLELIIVMLLASLMLGLGGVFVASTLPSARLASTARDISAAIRQTRLLAQNRGMDLALVFDLDRRLYGIEGVGVRKLPAEVSLGVVDPYSGIMRNGRYSMNFSSTGGIEGGVVVLSYKKKAIYIETDPVVGVVRLRQ